MDLENKALKEAFNKKYGMTKEERKSLGITDEEYENNKKNFAKKYYGLDKKEEPSFIDKAKKGLSEWYDWNLGGGRSDIQRIQTINPSDACNGSIANCPLCVCKTSPL